MKRHINQSLKTLREQKVPASLLGELENNIREVEKLHAEVLPSLDSVLGEESSFVGKRKERTLTDIIEDTSGIPMPNQTWKGTYQVVGVGQTRAVAIHRSKVPKYGKWTDGERELLVQGLRMFGTDFSMIAAMVIRGRTQKEVYKRFLLENRNHPELIDKALHWHVNNPQHLKMGFSRVLQSLQIDIDTFDPMAPQLCREDHILPLEHYLLNPPKALGPKSSTSLSVQVHTGPPQPPSIMGQDHKIPYLESLQPPPP